MPDDPNQQKERRRERNEAIKILTLISVGIYTVITAALFLTSQDSEHRSLRAYVGVASKLLDPFNTFTPPNTPTVKFDIRNSGQTPAYRVTHKSGGAVCDYPLGQNFPFAVIDKIHKGLPQPITVFPGTVDNLGIEDSISGPLPTDVFASIADGKTKRVCFWGTVIYYDAFKKRHYTNFCYTYFGTATFIRHEACEYHNDAD